MNKVCNNIYEEMDDIAIKLSIELWMKDKNDLLIIEYIDKLSELKKTLDNTK